MTDRLTGQHFQVWLGGPVPADPENPDPGDGTLCLGTDTYNLPDPSRWVDDSASGDEAKHQAEVLTNLDFTFTSFVDPGDTALVAAIAARTETEAHLLRKAGDTSSQREGMFVLTAAETSGVKASTKLTITCRYRGPAA